MKNYDFILNKKIFLNSYKILIIFNLKKKILIIFNLKKIFLKFVQNFNNF